MQWSKSARTTSTTVLVGSAEIASTGEPFGALSPPRRRNGSASWKSSSYTSPYDEPTDEPAGFAIAPPRHRRDEMRVWDCCHTVWFWSTWS